MNATRLTPIRPAHAALLVLLGLISGALTISVWAQPADAKWERGMPPPPDASPEMRGSPPGGHPLMMLLDTDRDGLVSASEIDNVAAILRGMDVNQDGTLSPDELVEAMPPPPGHRKGRRGERGMGPPLGNDF